MTYRKIYPALYRGSSFYYEIDDATGYHNAIFSRAMIATILGEAPEWISVVHERKGKKASFAIRKEKL